MGHSTKRKLAIRGVGQFLAFIVLFSVAHAQERPPATQRNKLQLSVECWRQNEWRAVDAQTVFNQQDRIRFRFGASFSGYLYILNHSSSGKVSWLFPVSGNSSNRVDSGHAVLIPGADGFYTIGGPRGFDTLYWILRSTPFVVPEVDAEQLDTPSTLISRCPEEERQKELACVDNNAGPKPLADPKKLQAALGIPSSLVARDLTFQTKPQATEIGTDSDGSSSGIIYQVRIAHN
jgi:Domain of unknown function (DUF4384)